MRVEQAMRLLPALESLAPLRGMVLAASRSDAHAVWASSGPYLTVGKRMVEPEELGRRMPYLLDQVTDHLRGLYSAYLEALACQQQGAAAGAVAALLRAGGLEQRAGRLTHATAWYEVALGVAEALPDRHPEIEVLQALAGAGRELGRYAESARHAQRALVLAEAEFDDAGAMASCDELGNLAVAQGLWAGAEAWYLRGLKLAEGGGWAAAGQVGQLLCRLGELARRRGDLTAAGAYLTRARERLEEAGEPVGLAGVLDALGQVEADLGRPAAAQGAHREALAWTRRAPTETKLEVRIRLNLAHLAIETGRYLEADEELRRAEQIALGRSDPHRLVEIYTLMGRLRGRQGDETGFVFFEQALELCGVFGTGALALTARVYREYGRFRRATGSAEEARAYLECARAAFESLGHAAELEEVRAELRQFAA